MKMKSIEQYRKIELLLCLIAEVGQRLGGLEADSTVTNVVSSLMSLDLITSNYSIRLTEEYQQLVELYDQALENIKDLFESLELDNAISIFSAFVTLYRSGYFSHNHQFMYSMDLKDFPILEGADVLCGKGVCRSIASLLTDVYKRMGYKSDILIVQANEEGINHLQNLNQFKLMKDEKASKYAQLIGKFTSVVPLPNHLITFVEENGKQYLLDPTNDGFLFYEHFGVLRNANDPNYYMMNHSIIKQLEHLLGVFPFQYTHLKKQETPPIDDIEYQQKYLYGVKQIWNNDTLINQFYENNEIIYNELYEISNEQNNLIKRLIPIRFKTDNEKEK